MIEGLQPCGGVGVPERVNMDQARVQPCPLRDRLQRAAQVVDHPAPPPRGEEEAPRWPAGRVEVRLQDLPQLWPEGNHPPASPRLQVPPLVRAKHDYSAVDRYIVRRQP